MEQLSALHSIGGEATSNPSSTLSLFISWNNCKCCTLVCKTEGEKDLFSSDWTEITLHAMPSTKSEIAGVDIHLSLFQGTHSCHYINLFQCHVCGLDFEWKATWVTLDMTVMIFPGHILYWWKITQFWAQFSSRIERRLKSLKKQFWQPTICQILLRCV